MNESLDEIERVFMAFADKTRLRLLHLMRNGEVSVNYLCESLGTSQPKVSRHLAYLRSMDVVKTRRDGKWIFYSLNVPASTLGSQLMRDMLAWVGSSNELTAGTNGTHFERLRFAKHEELDAQHAYVDTHMSQTSNELEVYLL